MKEITFLEAFQIIAVCRRKIYLKHIGKTPEDGTELVNIDEREEVGLLCGGLSPNISLLQPETYAWGSLAPHTSPTHRTKAGALGLENFPTQPRPAGIHYRGSGCLWGTVHRATERADPPSRAPLWLVIIM